MKFFGIDDMFNLPDKVMELVMSPVEVRDPRYVELLRLSGGDISVDWFQEAYEGEIADTKGKAQFFTPPAICKLMAEIATADRPVGSMHEPTAGTGGMVIAWWWEKMRRFPQEPFRPSEMMVNAWELSARSIPLLLLNLSIRGMMGYVTHGDTLRQTVIQRYALINRYDFPFAFSEVRKINENDRITRTKGQL